MAKIRARGYLIAGVDQNTYHFGYLNPSDGQIEGFDIDMLHAIAAAIFGNPDKIRFVAMSNDERIPALQSSEADIVAHTMTITCARWQQVDFSTVYVDAHQRVLVPSDSAAKGLSALSGQKVCTTIGSTSLPIIRAMPDVIAVTRRYSVDCLVPRLEGRITRREPGEIARSADHRIASRPVGARLQARLRSRLPAGSMTTSSTRTR